MNWHWFVPQTRGGCLVIPVLVLGGLFVVNVVNQLVQWVTS